MPKKQIWEFRDQNTPGRLLYLLRDQEITVTDFLLLCAIHSMVKPQGDGVPGRGCFASNEYLAKVIKNHPKYVSARISFLHRKKLLLVVRLPEKRRFLETEWARTGEERGELEGDYGVAYREAYFEMFGVRIKESWVRKTLPKSELGKENLTELGKENLTINKRIKQLNNNVGLPTDDVNHDSPDHKLDKKRAATLREAVLPILKRKGWKVPATEKETKEFAKTRLEWPEEQIDAVLRWYVRHIGDEFVPEVYSANTFRVKFERLARAMEKAGGELPTPKSSRVLSRTVNGDREVIQLRMDDED